MDIREVMDILMVVVGVRGLCECKGQATGLSQTLLTVTLTLFHLLTFCLLIFVVCTCLLCARIYSGMAGMGLGTGLLLGGLMF